VCERERFGGLLEEVSHDGRLLDLALHCGVKVWDFRFGVWGFGFGVWGFGFGV